MKDSVRTLLRSAQTSFPWAADARHEVQHHVRRTLRRPYEKDFAALRLLDLGRDPLLLDVGANRGQSIDSLALVCRRARIIAFEPNADLAGRLRRRYARRTNVEIRAVGLGDETGEFTLYVPVYKNYVFDGLASFSEEDARTWLEGNLVRFRPERLRIERRSCRVSRLDDLGLDPRVIKLDVQGFEHRALLGARETLGRARPVLLVESPSEALVDYLAPWGYRPHAFRDGRLLPDRMGSLNTFFLTEA
jgi:FkbM family methyltransferase